MPCVTAHHPTVLMRSIAALAVWLLLLATPSPTQACISPPPTLKELLSGAGAIVDGRLIGAEKSDPSYYGPDIFTIEVERVLRGTSPHTVVVDVPSTLCGDPLSIELGHRVIIALDFQYFGKPIAPYWSVHYGDVYGPDVPRGARTLDDIAALIARLPDTSTEHVPGKTWAWLAPLTIGAVALALLLVRPVSRRRLLPADRAGARGRRRPRRR